jgi:hypothetical protein
MRRISAPGATGRVVGATSAAAFVDIGGFIVAVSSLSRTWLPNAIGVAGGGLTGWPVLGEPVRFGDGADCAGLRISWNPARPPAFDPSLPGVLPAPELGERGRRMLVELGIEPLAEPARLASGFAAYGVAVAETREGQAAIELLLHAVSSSDADAGAAAARLLLGRGAGLTPEGDDLLAATAAVIGSVAPRDRALVAALVPPDVRLRTTSLSATLLELAASGYVAEPLRGALDLGAPDPEWRASLCRLGRLGATTGAAYAAAAGAVALLAGQ